MWKTQCVRLSNPGLPSTKNAPLLRRQQRLFTGAVFPEKVNDALCAFAQRHHLNSHIWVPKRAFEHALKPFGVFILPNAALCDILASADRDEADGKNNVRERILVNAQQTSNPHFLETFQQYLTQGAPRETSGRNHHFTVPFQYPLLAHTGDLVSDHRVARELIERQQKRGYFSNYWLKHDFKNAPVSYTNVEETLHPGRYNPSWSIQYEAHTYTNLRFSRSIQRHMRKRAAEYGYVSRMWLTLSEAENLFHTHLLPERAEDGPVIYSTDFTGGMEALAYYCADQFADSTEVFPSIREVDLAAAGVWVAPHKLRAFPLLLRVNAQSTHGSTNQGLSPGPGRVGADTGMIDAARHVRFTEEVAPYKDIRLYGVSEGVTRLLFSHGLKELLQKQCVLRDFPSRYFMNVKALLRYNLQVLPQEQGVLHENNPVQLHDNAWIQSDCWFNLSQLREAAVVLQMIDKPPLQFLTRRFLTTDLAVQCSRLQLYRQYPTAEWISQSQLVMTSWPLRRGAHASVINATMLLPSSSTRGGNSIFYNVADVDLKAEDISFLRHYAPVDERGRPFHGVARMLLTLRAHERGYTSRIWICVELLALAETQHYRLKDAERLCAVQPLYARHGGLRTFVFSRPPFVVLLDKLHFVNTDDLDCDAAHLATVMEQIRSREQKVPPNEEATGPTFTNRFHEMNSAESHILNEMRKQAPSVSPSGEDQPLSAAAVAVAETQANDVDEVEWY